MEYTVYLQGEAPKIGSGWRKVILAEERKDEVILTKPTSTKDFRKTKIHKNLWQQILAGSQQLNAT